MVDLFLRGWLAVGLFLSVWRWSRAADIPSSVLIELWVIVSSSIFLVKKWSKKEFLAWLVVGLWLLVVVWQSMDPWVALKWWLIDLLLVSLFISFRKLVSKWSVRELDFLMAVLLGVYFLIFLLSTWFNLQAYGLGRIPQMVGPFYWHNQMGGWLLLVSPTLLWWVYRRKEAVRRLLYLLIYATSLAMLGLTLSRGSWLAWLISATIIISWLALKKKLNRYWFLRWRELGIVLVLTFSFLMIFNRHIFQIVTGRTRVLVKESVGKEEKVGPASISWEYRLIAFKDTFQVIKRKPLLGVGLGNFRYYYRMVQSHPWIMVNFVHNQPLQVAAEIGIIGGVFWVVWVLWVIFSGLSFLVGKGRKDYQVGVLLLSWGFLGETLHSLIDMDLSLISLLFWYLLVAAVIVGLSSKKSKNFSQDEELSGGVTISLGLVLGLLMVYLIIGSKVSAALLKELSQPKIEVKKWQRLSRTAVRWYPFNYRNYFLTGLGYMRMKQFNTAYDWFTKARHLYPYSGELYYNLGVIFEAQKQPFQAEASYREALKINPLVSPRPYLKLAAFYMRHRQPQKAKEIFYRCAYQAFPKDKAFRALKWMYKYTDVILLRDVCEREYKKLESL